MNFGVVWIEEEDVVVDLDVKKAEKPKQKLKGALQQISLAAQASSR